MLGNAVYAAKTERQACLKSQKRLCLLGVESYYTIKLIYKLSIAGYVMNHLLIRGYLVNNILKTLELCKCLFADS